MKHLIVGLGNPGVKYENTRHNVGFMIVDQLAATKKATFTMKKHAWVAEIKHAGRNLILIKPATFMNLSGKAVNHYINFFSIPSTRLLVLVDDIFLPFGKLRLREKGSSGGHNGLRSIEEKLKSQDYPRLKFGLGANFTHGQQANYVLDPFNDEETKTLPTLLDKATSIILDFSILGLRHTIQKYN